MPRLYTVNCLACDTITQEIVEYTPPDTARKSGNGRYIVDLNDEEEYNGYPPKSVTCSKCGLPVIAFAENPDNKVPPVYFNYLGDD